MQEQPTIEQLYDLFSLSTGVNTDTRKIQPNEIFIALKGEHFNGNKFADQALEKGALYAFVDEEEFATSEQHILVENGLTTLQELAKYHRSTLDIPVIGLTGSNGKTTTKELIHAVLSMQYHCYATKGNLNNHIGVPLSILEITPEHDIAVIEMGANHLNEIAFLCTISKPSFGLITNIGVAHLEGFGSKENIRKGKGELYEFLKTTEEKTVFINGNDPVLIDMAKDLNRIEYGINFPISGEILSSNPLLKIKIVDEEQGFTIQTNLVGDYNFYNALCACAVGKYFNVPLLDIAEAIEEYKPKNHRSQYIIKDGFDIILDAYNANPSSMTLALENFAKQKNPKKIAILGHMLELGANSAEEHKKIVSLCSSLHIEAVFVGQLFQKEAKKANAKWFKESTEVNTWIKSKENSGYLLLLKGSRGVALENIFF